MLTTEKMNSAASVNVQLLPPADIVLEKERMVSVLLGDAITPARDSYCEDCKRNSSCTAST